MRIIAEIMSTDVLTVDRYEKVEIALEQMERKGVRHQVVTDQGKPESIVSHRDLLSVVYLSLSSGTGLTSSASPILVSQVCAKTPIMLSPKTPIIEALKIMIDKKISAIPVLENEDLKGILSTHDLLQFLLKRLIEEEEK